MYSFVKGYLYSVTTTIQRLVKLSQVMARALSGEALFTLCLNRSAGVFLRERLNGIRDEM